MWNTRAMKISIVGFIRNETGVDSVMLSHNDGNRVRYSPGFDTDTRKYNTWVPHSVNRIEVNATPKMAGDTVQATKGSSTVTADGRSLPLSVGSNEVTVFSTSGVDNQTTEEYSFNVGRIGEPENEKQLFSNLSRQEITSFGSNVYVAQKFKTGPNPAGYTVTKASVHLSNGNANKPAENVTYVRISTSSSHSATSSVVADFENPSSISNGSVNVFTAPSGTTLQPGRSYWLLIGSADGTLGVFGARSGLDDGTEFGWSIQGPIVRSSLNGGASVSNRNFSIKIEGYPTDASDDASVGEIHLEKEDDANVEYPVYPDLRTSDGRDYVAWLPNERGRIALHAFPSHDDASIAIHDDRLPSSSTYAGFSNLVEGENEFQFTITAPNGVTRTYTLVATRDPTTKTFVSNAEAADSTGTTAGQAGQFAVSFRTGSHDTSVLKEFDVLLADSNSTINIGSDNHNAQLVLDSGGTPGGGTVASFAPPSSYVDNDYNTFTFSSGASLLPDTSYWLVFNGSATNPAKPALTTSDDEDSGGLEDWTIGDTSVRRGALTDPWASVSSVPVVRLRGESTSTDARLLDLTVEDTDGDLGYVTPDVDSDTLAYYVPVGSTTTNIVLTAVPTHPGATVSMELRGTEFASGDETPALVTGRNKVDITITAVDGSTERVYSVYIERAGATTDLVSNLSVSGTTSNTTIGNVGINGFGQPFDTGPETSGYVLDEVRIRVGNVRFTGNEKITAYIYEVNSNTQAANSGRRVAKLISPDSFTKNSANIFKAPLGVRLDSDQFYTVAFIATGNSANDFEVGTTQGNSQTGKPDWNIADGYRQSNGNLALISLRMRLRGETLDGFDNTLNSLTFADSDGKTVQGLSPAFDKDTTSYTLNVMNRVETLTLNSTVGDAVTTVSISDDDDPSTPLTSTFDLDVGSNPITVVTEAPDGSGLTYTINVNRYAAPSAPTDCPADT